METILFLATTDADGSLGKPALEALGAAVNINNALAESSLVVGLVGEQVEPGANQIAACGAARFLSVS